MWYNEEELAPFFLNHYKWADEIHIIIDTDSNDRCEEIACKAENVQISHFSPPDGMDDEKKQKIINGIASIRSEDWIILADADEFILFDNKFLENVSQDIIVSKYCQPYRHFLDSDLDPENPSVEQRRHGNEIVDLVWYKPSVVRSRINPQWLPGFHSLTFATSEMKQARYYPEIQKAMHWIMADKDLAIERRINGRKNRQSKNNLEKGFSLHNHYITEEEIRVECEFHKHDPILF